MVTSSQKINENRGGTMDFITKIIMEETRKERRIKAIDIVKRSLRYVQGYLLDYHIVTDYRVYDDRIEAKITVYFDIEE